MSGQVAFVVGFPGLLATRLVRRLLQEPGLRRLLLLVDELQARALEEFSVLLPVDERDRLVPLYGKEGPMDFGLAGAEVRRITDEATHFWYLPTLPWPYAASVGEREPQRLVEGARELVSIARETRSLERLSYFSTAFVSGRRHGVVLEDELQCGQRFRSPAEEERFLAEVEVARAMNELPLTVLRPTLVVGDSQTGEFDPDSAVAAWLDDLLHATHDSLTNLPQGGRWPLHLVPLDYVVEAALFLSRHPRARQRTFHLVDPEPLPLRKVAELVARRRQGEPAAGGRLTRRLTSALLDLSGVRERWRRPVISLESFHQPVSYRTAGTSSLLLESSIRCPPLESYLDLLVDRLAAGRRERPAVQHHPLRWTPLPRHRLPIK